MAPMAPLGRERAMQLVAEGRLPLHFGSPHPCVAILEQDGVFRFRDLVIDEEEARAKSREALAQGKGWMPENHYALGRPTGRIHAEAKTRDELIAILRTMKWQRHW